MLSFDDLLDILPRKTIIISFYYLNNEIILAASGFSWSSLPRKIRRSANFWLGISGCLNDATGLDSVDRDSFRSSQPNFLMNACYILEISISFSLIKTSIAITPSS
jgi:hypothetical protein